MRIHSQFTPKCINFSFQKFARFKIKNGLYHYIEISDIYLKKNQSGIIVLFRKFNAKCLTNLHHTQKGRVFKVKVRLINWI